MTATLIALIRPHARGDAASLGQWLQRTAPTLLRNLRVDHCIVNVADRRSPWAAAQPDPVPLYDAVVEVPLAGDPATAGESLRTLLAHNAEVHVYQADKVVQKSVAVDSSPAINLLAVWDAKRGQPAAETRRHWLEHVPLAVSIHHGATRYIQSWLEDPLTPTAPAHAGIATLRFPSMEVMAGGLFRNAADVATINADVAEFIEASHVMYTTETVFGGKA